MVIGKSFAFVEFSTHAAAKSVVEASVRRGIMVQGRTISVGMYAYASINPANLLDNFLHCCLLKSDLM